MKIVIKILLCFIIIITVITFVSLFCTNKRETIMAFLIVHLRDVFGFSVLCHPEHQRVIAIIQDFRLVTDDFYCCIHGNSWFKHRFKQTSENAPKIKHKKSSQISLTA